MIGEKIAGIITLVFIFLSFEFTYPQTSDSIKIMPLGDSITEGVDKDSLTHERGYRRTLYQSLVNYGLKVNF
ncbi:MAG: hypothetical protein ACM339_01285, partial [Ignavibacteria bacterium]